MLETDTQGIIRLLKKMKDEDKLSYVAIVKELNKAGRKNTKGKAGCFNS